MNEHKTVPGILPGRESQPKPRKAQLNSSALMREIAKIAGIEMGLFQKMTLTLVAGEPPILVTEGFIPEAKEDTGNQKAAPRDSVPFMSEVWKGSEIFVGGIPGQESQDTVTTGRWYETSLPLRESLYPTPVSASEPISTSTVAAPGSAETKKLDPAAHESRTILTPSTPTPTPAPKPYSEEEAAKEAAKATLEWIRRVARGQSTAAKP